MTQKLSDKGTQEKKQSTNEVSKPHSGPRKQYVPMLLSSWNIKNFSFTELEVNNERSKTHMIAYPRLNESTFVFQTPEFTITQYGIPQKGDFVQTDAQRTTLKFPFDPHQPGCVELEKMFTDIDNYVKANHQKIFTVDKVKNSKFAYTPIIREPIIDDTIEDPKNKKGNTKNQQPKEKFKFWKAKLDLSFEDGEIQTVIFKKNPNDPTVKPDKITSVKTVTDLEQFLPWGSKVRMIVMMNKLWAEKTAKTKGADRNFGLSFKILSIETTPREKNSTIRESIENYAFLDTDQVHETAETKNKESSVQGQTVEEEEEDEEAEEDDDEEEAVDAEEADEEEAGEGDDNDEEEKEPEPPKKKVVPTKVATNRKK